MSVVTATPSLSFQTKIIAPATRKQLKNYILLEISNAQNQSIVYNSLKQNWTVQNIAPSKDTLRRGHLRGIMAHAYSKPVQRVIRINGVVKS